MRSKLKIWKVEDNVDKKLVERYGSFSESQLNKILSVFPNLFLIEAVGKILLPV